MVRVSATGCECNVAQPEVSNLNLQDIVTPIDVKAFKKLLVQSGYNPVKSKFLVHGFTRGFDVGYRGPQQRRSHSNNLPFMVGSPSILWQKLLKEVQLGRVAGPFKHIPFEFFMQSPIGLVPKDDGKQTRLIFHLSYQFHDGLGSLNSNTPDHLCTVKYKDLDRAVKLILKMAGKSPQGVVYLSKTDVKSAFRLVPLSIECRKWLVMKARNPVSGEWAYFVDKCLPFGASISCALFQEVSDAVAFVFEYKVAEKGIVNNYLDDYLLLAVTLAKCNQLMLSFLQLCDQIRLPISMEKTEWATPFLVFLGIHLNGVTLTLSFPSPKKTESHRSAGDFYENP